jgi:ribosomal protein S7
MGCRKESPGRILVWIINGAGSTISTTSIRSGGSTARVPTGNAKNARAAKIINMDAEFFIFIGWGLRR